MVQWAFMADQSAPRDLVAGLVRELRRRGVDYADVRYEHLLHESLVAEDGRVSSISLFESAGVGVRVLRRGSWGFAATPHLTRAALARTAA
ncbi:MAG: peptidase U62 modulator of DNA gyrase, partial [Elusimicrobia bacterium]